MPPRYEVIGIEGIPEIRRGDDLGRLIADAARQQGTPLATGDLLVVSQKIVSKMEGRLVRLGAVSPSPRAAALAAEIDRDPRLVEVILGETRRIVRQAKGVLIGDTVVLRKARDLRYGANPQQKAALYREATGRAGSLAEARQIQGPDPTYNDLLDLDAAWRTVSDFSAPSCSHDTGIETPSPGRARAEYAATVVAPKALRMWSMNTLPMRLCAPLLAEKRAGTTRAMCSTTA